jgi:hypothetical protein
MRRDRTRVLSRFTDDRLNVPVTFTPYAATVIAVAHSLSVVSQSVASGVRAVRRSPVGSWKNVIYLNHGLAE